MRLRIVCASMLVVAQGFGHAQDRVGTTPTFRAEVALIEVAAVVAGADGRSLNDLVRDDFEVLEDGQARPLVSLRRVALAEGAPASSAARIRNLRAEPIATNIGLADAPAFVLVLDDLNTSPYDAHRVIRAGLGVLGAMPPQALIAVVTTSGVGGTLLTLAPSGPEHAAAIGQFRGRMLLTGPKPPAGAEALTRAWVQPGSTVDSPCGAVAIGRAQQQDCGDPTRAARRAEVVKSVAHLLGRAGSRRKVVFWVTEDMGVSPLDSRGNQAAQREALHAVLNADVAVYPVNPREGHADFRNSAELQEGDRGDNRPDRRTGGRVRFGPGDGALGSTGGASLEFNTDDMVAVTLDQLARESGGRWINNANDLDVVLRDVVRDNLASYVLAFEGAETRTPGFHRIEVRVRRQGARVFARRGYFVAPDARRKDARPGTNTASLVDLVMGTVPQGQLGIRVQAVPGFLTGRAAHTAVIVNLDAESVGDVPVDVMIVAVTQDGKIGTPQIFKVAPTGSNSPEAWTFVTSLSLPRGSHQVRVAAMTANREHSGLVIAPVSVVAPGKDLSMAPPILLRAKGPREGEPMLAYRLDRDAEIRLQTDVAGGPVREGRVTVSVQLHDADGAVVRKAEAQLAPGGSPDQRRATGVLQTFGLPAGAYALVVEATDSAVAFNRPQRYVLPVSLNAAFSTGTLAGATSPTGSGPAGEPLHAVIVAHGPSTNDTRLGPRIIRDSANWQAFWRQLPTRQPIPEVDFERVTLLVFVIESRPESQVRPVIERVERNGNLAVVVWRHASAGAGTPRTVRAPDRAFLVAGIVGHVGPVDFKIIE